MRALPFALALLAAPAGAAFVAAPVAAQSPPQSLPGAPAVSALPGGREAPPARPLAEPPVSVGVTTGAVSVAPLGPPGASSGVLPSNVTGLPDDLWAGSDAGLLSDMIGNLPESMPRAARALERVMMLAEADPPASGDAEALLAARLARLVDRGHLDAAAALAARTGARSPTLRREAFDIALLMGDESEACQLTDPEAEDPQDYGRRVFCLVRVGDFAAAATVLDSARALGRLDPVDEVLLEIFLYPELLDEIVPPEAPRRPTPMQFRLYEALGEPLATRDLPVAFARSDMRPINGLKAQIEAAERLARAGALEGSRLLALYTDRRPSASGGVWDRAAALRDLDAALMAANRQATALALPRAVEALDAADLTATMADAIYPQVAALAPEGAEAETAALRLGLMSSDYEAAAGLWPEADAPHVEAARAVARGEAPEGTAPGTETGAGSEDALDAAVRDAFAPGAPIPERLSRPAAEGRLGEALLLALSDLSAGEAGDRGRLAGALAFLRSVGLEDTARRTAIELLIGRDAA